MNQNEMEKQNLKFLIESTKNILDWTFEKFSNKIFSTTAFGANGTVLLDILKKMGQKDIPFYFINTGYHFKETLNTMNHYKKNGFNIIEVFPDVYDSQHLLKEMDPDLCCSVNKVEPMSKILRKNKGNVWLAAVSRDQSKTRNNFRFLEKQDYNIIKIGPMLIWKEDEIWRYIRENKLYYNKLYDKGYKSIGCEPCTTKVREGENSRAGRWRGRNKDECGLHTQFGR